MIRGHYPRGFKFTAGNHRDRALLCAKRKMHLGLTPKGNLGNQSHPSQQCPINASLPGSALLHLANNWLNLYAFIDASRSHPTQKAPGREPLSQNSRGRFSHPKRRRRKPPRPAAVSPSGRGTPCGFVGDSPGVCQAGEARGLRSSRLPALAKMRSSPETKTVRDEN